MLKALTNDDLEQKIKNLENENKALRQTVRELQESIPRPEQNLRDQNSELKEQIEKLKNCSFDNETLFQHIINNVADCFILHNFEGKILDVNEYTCKSLGYNRNDLLNMYIQDVDQTFYSEKHLEKWKTMVPSIPITIEGIHKCKDSTTFPVEVRLVHINSMKGRLILCLARDISHRKEIEKALEESKDKFKTFMETASDYMFMTDKQSCFTYVNNSMSESLGYAKEEMIGMHFTQLLGSDALKKLYPKKNRELTRKGRISFEGSWVSKEKKKIYGEVKVVAVSDSDGNFIGARGVLRDITKRKQIEQQLLLSEMDLKIQKKSLEEMNTALRVLLKNREKDREELGDSVVLTVKKLVEPYVKKLMNSRLEKNHKALLGVIESNLEDIISPFSKTLSSQYSYLTPMEIEISNLIKQGRTSKEIANILNSSYRTVNFHREKIRKKLGICNVKTNLRSYLMTLQ